MPAQRNVATFEPVPPDLDLDALVEQTPNFRYADRIRADMIEIQGMDAFEKLVNLHVVQGGKPLVVEGFQQKLEPWTFSTRWLRDNHGKKFEQARVLNRGENMPLSISHYLEHMAMLTNQWTPQNYRERTRQRLYLKDIDCPSLWHDKLREELPPGIFYLSQSTGDIGGPGATGEDIGNGVGAKLGRGAARAGDLMSCLPEGMRAENLMCYIGHEGTYTPAHREMCASLGQNIMVETSGVVGEDGKPTKPGSSIWFMTETKERHRVAEFWLSTLGHDVEVENHFAQINAWKEAPFVVYFVEQKVGDLILIPPLAPHQVWNRGTRTMKVAWNRTTVETLDHAMKEALHNARMVCRDEQYKCKSIVLFALNRYSGLLNEGRHLELGKNSKIRQLQKDFKRLFKLFTQILVSEMFSKERPKEKCEYVPYDSNITCSYCRCNIFNRFLTCKSCVVHLDNGDEDTYDICLECYVMGRSCKCRSRLTWAEQFPWKDLVEKYEIWRRQIVDFPGGISDSGPLSIDVERKEWPRKTLAEICQEQLQKRPFKDPKKSDSPEPEEEDEELQGNGQSTDQQKKSKRKHPEKWYRDNPKCHHCCKRHPKWKVATCSCGTSICYGSLWRGYELFPQKIMEQFDWKCPKCQRICSCTVCANPEPYKPRGTIPGHDTRKFADPRSVEHLVDFSISNMFWVKKAGDNVQDGSERMLRKQHEVAEARNHDMAIDDDVGQDGHPSQFQANAGLPLDPQLAADFQSGAGESNDVMQAAQTALNMMNNLSQLEQDPERFIAQAGLRASQHEDSVAYEYPDPNAAQMISQTKAGIEAEPQNTKRKRGRDLPIVQSDMANDVNVKFQQEQEKQSMEEAKRQGRLISAKAAITGQKKIVTLRLRSQLLSRFVAFIEAEQPTVVPAEAPHSPLLVESDLPKKVSPSVAAARNPQVPKKRRRGEVDEDFATSKREERRSLAKRNAANKLAPEAHDSDVEMASQSEPDLEESLFVPDRDGDAPKRRTLPAYLARRSPVDETELPKELTNGSSSRRAPRPSKSSFPNKSLALEASSAEETALPAAPPTPDQAVSKKAAPTAIMLPNPPTSAMPSGSPHPIHPPSFSGSLDGTGERSSSESEAESHIGGIPASKSSGPAPVAKAAAKPPIDPNQKAKLRALGELSESDSDYSDEVTEPSPPKNAAPPPKAPVATLTSSNRPRGRPPKSAEKDNGISVATTTGSAPKKSIFSKFGRGKVKIRGKRRS